MNNHVFCIFRTETDDYTYSCEILTGIFLTAEEAETALLAHIMRMEKIDAALKLAKEKQDAIYARWRRESFPKFKLAMEEVDLELYRTTEGVMFTSARLGDYEIRPVTLGEVLVDYDTNALVVLAAKEEGRLILPN